MRQGQVILVSLLGLLMFDVSILVAQSASALGGARAQSESRSPVPIRLPSFVDPQMRSTANEFSSVDTAGRQDPTVVLGLPRPLFMVSQLARPEDADATEDSADPAAPADAQTDEGNASDTADKLGEAPEDVSQVFVRSSAVLLEPGEGQWEWGLTYGRQHSEFPVVLPSGVLGLEQIRQRSWIVPASMRYGLVSGTEVFAQVPVGAAAFERSHVEDDARTSRFGIGDLSAGIKHVFREERGECPDVIGSVSVTAPTGVHSFEAADTAALGNGFWSVATALSVVKTYHPAVLFASGGYGHDFAREFSGTRIQPGEELNFSFGMGMAINDKLIASAEAFGTIKTYLYADDRRIPNSWQEPLSLRLGLTRIVCENRFIEPFLTFGLNSDAADFQFGVLWTNGF